MFLGGSLKYIDFAYERNNLKKVIAIILSIICGYLMWFLSMEDTTSAIIFASIIIGVFISGKVDNLAFYLGTITFGAFFLRFTPETDKILVAILAIASILDEKIDRIMIKIGRAHV